MMQDWTSYLTIVLVGVCTAMFLTSALHDVASRTVPNSFSLVIASAGLVLRLLDGTAPIAIGLAVAALVVFRFCWRMGWMGGGDVKLIAATALAIPPAHFLSFVTIMSVAGAILALPYLAGRSFRPFVPPGRPNRFIGRVMRAERWRLRNGGPLPYACAIAAGGLSALL